MMSRTRMHALQCIDALVAASCPKAVAACLDASLPVQWLHTMQAQRCR